MDIRHGRRSSRVILVLQRIAQIYSWDECSTRHPKKGTHSDDWISPISRSTSFQPSKGPFPLAHRLLSKEPLRGYPIQEERNSETAKQFNLFGLSFFVSELVQAAKICAIVDLVSLWNGGRATLSTVAGFRSIGLHWTTLFWGMGPIDQPGARSLRAITRQTLIPCLFTILLCLSRPRCTSMLNMCVMV